MLITLGLKGLNKYPSTFLLTYIQLCQQTTALKTNTQKAGFHLRLNHKQKHNYKHKGIEQTVPFCVVVSRNKRAISIRKRKMNKFVYLVHVLMLILMLR